MRSARLKLRVTRINGIVIICSIPDIRVSIFPSTRTVRTVYLSNRYFCIFSRARVELARDSRFGRSPPRGGSGGGGGGFRRGIPPGRKTEYRLVVENLASRTSWQVKRAQVPPGPRTREEGGFIPLTWSWEENRSQQKSHCVRGLLSSSTTHGNECQFSVLYSRFIVDTHIGKLTGSPNPPPPLRGVW